MSEIPCGLCQRGAPFGPDYDINRQCRLCWLYYNHAAYRSEWEGVSNDEAMNRVEAYQRQYAQNRHALPTAQPGQVATLPPEPPPKPIEQGPSWFRRAINFSRSAVRHVWHGLPEAATEEQERRIAICLACEHLDQNNGACRQCGCPARRKSSWALESCPLEKW
jgi:hypothetical protein